MLALTNVDLERGEQAGGESWLIHTLCGNKNPASLSPRWHAFKIFSLVCVFSAVDSAAKWAFCGSIFH